MEFIQEDLIELTRAKTLLEHPGFTTRLLGVLGKPLEAGLDLMPRPISGSVKMITEKSLRAALNVAVKTLPRRIGKSSRDRMHKMAVTLSGFAGGFWGVTSLAVELPISTIIILRSIGEIALSEGEDIDALDTRMACMEVFAFGGSGDAGYYGVRAALSQAMAEASAYIAKHGMVESGAPALVRLISQIGARFGIVVSEKMAAQLMPIIGALGGATINTVFIDHFQGLARGHFIIRRLERKYGTEIVKDHYHRIIV